MSNDNSVARKAAIAAAVGVGAVGAYLVYKRWCSSPTASQAFTTEEDPDKLTVEQLKQLGNKLFGAKKYAEAIEIFTKAVAKDEEGSQSLRSQCYQNRAASKERLGSYSAEDMLSDVMEALKLNPGYGKAYFRKARLHQKLNQFHECLAATFCAISLDSALDQQSGAIIAAVLEEAEKLEYAKWAKSHVAGQPMRVRVEKVYAWLHKTVHNDILRNEVLAYQGESSSPYTHALQLIKDVKYDLVASEADKEPEDSSKKREALLIAARFHLYANNLDEFKRCIDEFDTLNDKVVEVEGGDPSKTLLSSKHVLLIESNRTKDEIIRAFYEALTADISNSDFYAMAAFRLVLCGEAHEAMKLLMTENVQNDVNVRLLRSTLQILANTDGNLAAASLHNAIVELEKFVQSLYPQTSYSQTLLAKVYATFGNLEPARELMDKVIAANPTISIHYYDRSCMVENAAEPMPFLEKCLELEPFHAEANLMYASLKLNQAGNQVISKSDYEQLSEYINRAASTFDSSIDFPVIGGVFKMRAVLEAKKQAALDLGGFH